MTTTQQKKFIDLLKEIFQFDQADLDFGIYRIMNQKRDEVTNFLEKELVPQVQKAFEKYKNADIETIKQQIEDLEKKLSDMGVAKESSEKYKTLTEQLNQGVDVTALENEVFSDLTSFFRRYYDNGDFISLRRYKKDVYAIPYEGEEVKLHWANSDQYYVKTSEYFRDYTFKLPSERTVHFKLIEANTEQNNNKAQEGKERRFILFEEDPIKEENGELFIHFEYRPAEGKQTQKQLNEITLEKIFSFRGHSEWLKELQALSPTEKNKKRTLLEKYLNDYTARNTFDYFIHKDLGGFLRRELDFFIKNEIMHLDDLDTENEKRFEQYLSKVKVIKSIGQKIIAFLEQIETFQKKLWLKKKFVVETNYCITLDRIPEEFYPEIIQNRKQIEEWIELFAIPNSDTVTVEYLKDNHYLLLDTAFFNESFKRKILNTFDDLDSSIDGLMINTENFQGLNLIKSKYSNNINGIYIDPPYNTDATEIIYKNGYKDSSWLSLMSDRINQVKSFLKDDGILCVTIDDYEVSNLSKLLSQNLDNYQIRPMIIEYNHRGRVKSNFAVTHEYALWAIKKGRDLITRRKENADDIRRNLRRTGTDSTRQASPGLFYGIEVEKETLKIVGTTEPLKLGEPIPVHNNPKTDMIWPIDNQGVERRWYYGKQRVLDESLIGSVWAKRISGEIQIHYHQTGKPKLRKSVWVGSHLDASTHGSELLNDMFGLGKSNFSFPKSLYAVKECLESMTYDKDALFMDFFAGSGTTAHGVIELNREDNGNRKYIIMEMGEYFNSDTKPRIQKAIYSKDWKDGKPESREGISHMFKYMKLESYEDALNNIQLTRSSQQQSAMDEMMSPEAKEEYILSYMLDVEAEGSTSLLNIGAFTNPFDYKMMITKGTESIPSKVDIVETFNYLIGLHVKTIDSIRGITVITGTLRTGENTLVLWRNTNEVTNEQLEDFFKKQGYNTRDSEFERIYVNGDNHLENLKLAENKWKVVLIEEEFKRLMFDVQDI